MQFKKEQFNRKEHDLWRALTVKQPYASALVTPAYKEGDDEFAVKSIEVRSKNTHYRGKLMICSSSSPEIYGLESGVSVGTVDLYAVKPCKDFTVEDWENTRIPQEEWGKHKKSFGWMMKNPKRVIEFPVKGQLSIFTLVYTKDTIIEYPTTLLMDKQSYLLATKKVSPKK